VKQQIATAFALIIGTARGIPIQSERRLRPPKIDLNASPTSESRSPSPGHRSTLRRRSGVGERIADVVPYALVIVFAVGAAYVIATAVLF
jgi:hypothetical protein